MISGHSKDVFARQDLDTSSNEGLGEVLLKSVKV